MRFLTSKSLWKFSKAKGNILPSHAAQSGFLEALNYSSLLSTSPAKLKMTQSIRFYHKYEISKNSLYR